MGKKDDVNTGHDGLINGILGAPLMGMIGGIPGMIAGLFLGATFDEIDRRKAAANYNPTPPGAYIEARNRELERKKEEDIKVTPELEELMKDAKVVKGWSRKEDFYQISFGSKNLYAKEYLKDGRLGLYRNANEYYPIKEWDAELYYRPFDFLERLKSDLKSYRYAIKLYKINGGRYGRGSYMYTINYGESYVVCARDCRLELKQRKEAGNIDQLI